MVADELPVVAVLLLVVLPLLNDDPVPVVLLLELLPLLVPVACCGAQTWPGGQGTAATGGRKNGLGRNHRYGSAPRPAPTLGAHEYSSAAPATPITASLMPRDMRGPPGWEGEGMDMVRMSGRPR